jgi:hypothetical protein
MAKPSPQKIRSEIAKDLREFGRKLVSSGIILDSTQFETAATECQNNSHGISVKGHGKDDLWGYNLNRIIVRLEKKSLKHIQPNFVSDISLEYSVNVAGFVKNFEQLSDPLCSLNFNILITAKKEKDDQVNYKNCWHLDKNIAGGNAPQDVHPSYHFHFGGRNMNFNADQYQYGMALFLDSPRLAHKPMDGILATDFVLANYKSDKWMELRDEKKGDGEYKNIVERAYGRLWKPYAHATSSFFGNFQSNQLAWNPDEIWPQLLTNR